jgi:hypothetical protein
MLIGGYTMQQPPNQDYPQTYILDNIPFEEQRVIDELVELWQTHDEPRDLLAHIRDTLKTGYSITFFFAQVRNDYSKYATSSASEFRQFLEDEYRRVAKPYAISLARAKAFDEAQAKAEAERQAEAQAIEAEAELQVQAIAEECEEQERRARIREERIRRYRAYFDALGEEMAKTTTREELVALRRKRAAVAQYLGIHPYENVCWKCHNDISSAIHAQCKVCRWYICSLCGSCNCNRISNHFKGEAVDPFLPHYPDDLS